MDVNSTFEGEGRAFLAGDIEVNSIFDVAGSTTVNSGGTQITYVQNLCSLQSDNILVQILTNPPPFRTAVNFNSEATLLDFGNPLTVNGGSADLYVSPGHVPSQFVVTGGILR